MISLQEDVLVLDRTQDDEEILPLLHPGKRGRESSSWFIDLGIEQQDVLNFLMDAEVLDEEIALRYIARDGRQAEARAQVEELLPGEGEGHLCRLRGVGTPPPAVLEDAPRII